MKTFQHYLYAFFVISSKQFPHFCRDFVVALNALGAPKSWRVDDSQRVRDAETVPVMDIVET